MKQPTDRKRTPRRTAHPRSVRSAAGALAALLALVLAWTSLAVLPAAAAVGGPALDRNFPDPDIVKAGSTYHAYATNGDGKNIQRATSTDLVDWSVSGTDPLPRLGNWAVPERSLVWAPEVFDNGNGFTMLYTARDRATNKQCIGAALSASPQGPFQPADGAPLVCPGDRGGAIDASSYTENGQRYVLWKNDGNCCGQDTWLYLQPLSWDGTRTTGAATGLIKQDRSWEGALVEAPTLVKHGGRYVLFYSAGHYGDASYKTGYATATSLNGPYTKAPSPLMTTDTFAGSVRGPGGQDVVTGPDGRDRIVFHGWSGDYSRRAMYVADLGWANDHPVVRGSKVIHQAENARVNNAVVRDAAGALDGRAVGRIDHADSFVEFTVFAASAGRHTLTVRYGNGSSSGGSPVASSHRLSVNGNAADPVAYPHTGWDNWRHVGKEITLAEGWNTVRLAKGDHWAELDSIEIA
ncbi:family 43 glycosylhydrolase [Streptomyces enissocaesilis]|uniref:CBM6 domain-containing protein n=1 Tax=Streptomyces enissocaesilis TaxID=332589 RepID=A0ABP6JQ68_9ACTN